MGAHRAMSGRGEGTQWALDRHSEGAQRALDGHATGRGEGVLWAMRGGSAGEHRGKWAARDIVCIETKKKQTQIRFVYEVGDERFLYTTTGGIGTRVHERRGCELYKPPTKVEEYPTERKAVPTSLQEI